MIAITDTFRKERKNSLRVNPFYNPVHVIKILVTGFAISRPPGISGTWRVLKTNAEGYYITLEIIPLWGIDYLTLHILLWQDNLKSIH